MRLGNRLRKIYHPEVPLWFGFLSYLHPDDHPDLFYLYVHDHDHACPSYGPYRDRVRYSWNVFSYDLDHDHDHDHDLSCRVAVRLFESLQYPDQVSDHDYVYVFDRAIYFLSFFYGRETFYVLYPSDRDLCTKYKQKTEFSTFLYKTLQMYIQYERLPVSIKASRILPLSFQTIPFSLSFIVFPTRVLNIYVWTTSSRSSKSTTQPSRKPPFHGSGTFDIHQHSATIYFLTIRMLISS